MKTFSELKYDARFHLRGAWGYAIVVVLITGLITGSVSSVVNSFSGQREIFSKLMFVLNSNGQLSTGDLYQLLGMTRNMMTWAAVGAFLNFLLSIFLFNPFQTSVNNWFIRNRETPSYPGLDMLFRHFGSNYPKLLGGRAWETLWYTLWSLPQLVGSGLIFLYSINFVMPDTIARVSEGSANEATAVVFQGMALLIIGSVLSLIGVIFTINRSFAYMMNAYILADNPDIGYRRSLKLSIAIMKGHKFRLFMLELSFIGWALLAILTCGVGFIVLSAYMNQTIAEFYAERRASAAAAGLASMEEFGFTAGGPGHDQGYDVHGGNPGAPFGGGYQQPPYQQHPGYGAPNPQYPPYQQPQNPQYPPYQQPQNPQYPPYQQPQQPSYPPYQQPNGPAPGGMPYQNPPGQGTGGPNTPGSGPDQSPRP